MDVNNLKKDVIYVLNKNEGIIAVFNKEDEDTLIDPIIEEIQNGETTLTFQVPASSEKWKNTYNPENLYLVDNKVFSANFSDAIERERDENDEDIITVRAYERQKLLEREYVRAWNSETGFENIDDFMVVIVSGGDLDLKNDGNIVTTTHAKGTSGYVLDGLLYGTGWTTGVCDVEGVFDLETDQETIYDNIMAVQEIWGGILVFDSLNKVVHHRDETKFLPYSGYEVKYQKNLQSSKYIGDNKIITMLCPLGEGGLNIKDVNNGSLWLTNFSYTNSELRAIENNDSIYEQDQLLRWGQRKLAELCKPRRELSMTTALLSTVEGYELEEVHLNDIVDVIDFEFVEDRVTQLRVIEYKHYVWSGADATLVIGDITLDSTDILKKAAKATNLINNGTLDTTKVVDYYKNGQSLRQTLRQIDQVITDTKAELIATDEALNARITQTITRVDNLNNDIISQDTKISEMLITIDEINTKVNAVMDLTDTISSTTGEITITDAVEGYLYGLSVHGYEGSFRANYFSEDTYFSEDRYFADNELAIKIETDNKFPSNPEEWNVSLDKRLSNNLIDNLQIYTGKNNFSMGWFSAARIWHVGIDGSATENVLKYIEVSPHTTYKIKLKDESIDTRIAVGTYNSTLFDLLVEYENNPSYSSEALNSYGNAYINNQGNLVYDYTQKTLEFTTQDDEYFLIIPWNVENYISNWVLLEDNVERYEYTYTLESDYIEVDEDYSMFLSLKGNNENYAFTNLKYYNENKNLLYTYEQYFNRDILNGLKEVKILFPSGTKYMKIEMQNVSNKSTYSIEEMIQDGKPMLEYCSKYKNNNTYSGELSNTYAQLDYVEGYNSKAFSNLPTFTDKTELELCFEDLSGDEEISPICGTDNTGFVFYNKFNNSYKTKLVYYNNTMYEFNTTHDFHNIKTTLLLRNNSLTLQDELGNIETLELSQPSEAFESVQNFTVLGVYDYSVTRVNSKLYYSKIWENSELIKDILPTIIKSRFLLDDELREMTITEGEETTTIYDEFMIQDKKATVIRRIGVTDQGEYYELTEPQYIAIGDADINLVQGDNDLEILHYTPTIIVEYVKKNEYTQLFATTLELESSIKQTADQINLQVGKKVGNDEIIARINMAVVGNTEDAIPEDIDKSVIEILANKISIMSDYFQLTKDGKITATAGYIAGWKIEHDRLSNNTSEIINKEDEDIQFAEDILRIGKGLGLYGDDAFVVDTKGGIRGRALELHALSNAARYPTYIALFSDTEQTGTYITSDEVDTGHVIAGDGIARGYCMHSPDLDKYPSSNHTYWCHLVSSNGAMIFTVDAGPSTDFNTSNWWINRNTSDERLKHDIEPINENLLKLINELELKQFVFNDTPSVIGVGVIAQDFLKLIKKYHISKEEMDKYEIVKYGIDKTEENPEGFMAIDYSKLQLLKIKCLEIQNQKLEEKYDSLLKRIEKLEGEK